MIKFKLPFDTPLFSTVSITTELPKSKEYICANCTHNCVSWLGEDKGCTLNERIKGDTVTECGSFKRA